MLHLGGCGSPISASVMCVKQSAISDRLLECNYTVNFDDFDILTEDSNKFILVPRESLLMKPDRQILNRMIKSFPLDLFG